MLAQLGISWRPGPARLSRALALVLLCLAPLACSGDKAPANRGRPPAPVSVAEAVNRDVPVLIKAIARVEASASVSLKSRITGQLLSVHFKQGAFVKQGDLLFTIDPRPFQVTLKEAEAALAREQALSAKAVDDLKRFEELVGRKVVSASQYEQYLTDSRTRAAALAAATAAVENARLQLSYCYIHAPISGPTGSLLADVGNMIKANDDNKSLVVIQQIEPAFIAFNVPERHLAEIRAAMAKESLPVEATLPGREDRPLTGELFFVDNAVDTATGTIRLKASFPNRDHLLWPAQFVGASLRLANLDGALVVPSRAVQSGQIGDFVFVVTPENTVEARRVVPGPRLDGDQVIASGLKPGERVVTDGHLRLVPGAKVEIKPEVGGPGADGRS